MKIQEKILQEFISENALPAAFHGIATDYYLPLAVWVSRVCTGNQHSVIGINGAQGSGKTTLADFLRLVLSTVYGMRCVVLSIDDIYLTRDRRKHLAEQEHPLLKTRGVPGTHDIELGRRLLNSLDSLQEGEVLRIPRFDKLSDDRIPEEDWDEVTGPVDIVLFEGWCVGSVARPSHELEQPLNQLEALQDGGGQWRQYANRQLAGDYADFFSRLNKLIFLQVPDLGSVRRWRQEQEDKLARAALPGRVAEPMKEDEIRQFVEYFERITLGNLCDLPDSADVVVQLNHDHLVDEVIYRD
jgi:D-glycerate 3-kinase